MKAVLVSILLATMAGCGGHPQTAALPVFTDCGKMPDRAIICRDMLSPTADDATVARCYAASVEELLAENETLRARYAPCAKGTTPVGGAIEKPAPCRFWQVGCRQRAKSSP